MIVLLRHRRFNLANDPSRISNSHVKRRYILTPRISRSVLIQRWKRTNSGHHAPSTNRDVFPNSNTRQDNHILLTSEPRRYGSLFPLQDL